MEGRASRLAYKLVGFNNPNNSIEIVFIVSSLHLYFYKNFYSQCIEKELFLEAIEFTLENRIVYDKFDFFAKKYFWRAIRLSLFDNQ